MANLDRIANVTVSLSTASVASESFSDLLIVGPFSGALSRHLIVTSADDLLDYGVGTSDPLYQAVATAFSQTPHIAQVYVGRKAVDSVSASITTAAAGAYTLTLKHLDASGVEHVETASYTAVAGDDASDIAAGLDAAYAGTALSLSASAGTLTITPSAAAKAFSVSVTAGDIALANGTSSEAYTDALAAIAAEAGGWYGVAIVSRAQADILAAAAWCEANSKLFGFATAEAGALSTVDTANTLAKVNALGYARSFGFYHALAATEWPEVALMANRFTYYPGAENWANVKLSAVTVDAMTEAQAAAVKLRYGNTYEQFRNVAITQNGYVAAGEWIDVIRFRDWLVDQIKVELVSLLVRASAGDGKVPYTAAGIQMVKAALKSVLDLGVSRGGIAPEESDGDGGVIPSYTITVPQISSISATVKATRMLSDVSFTARLAGAINNITLKGVLSYEG